MLNNERRLAANKSDKSIKYKNNKINKNNKEIDNLVNKLNNAGDSSFQINSRKTQNNTNP